MVNTVTVLGLHDDLKSRIVEALPAGDYLGPILKRIRESDSSTSHCFRFDADTGLLYFVDAEELSRICIPEVIQQDVLQQAHDDSGHLEVEKTYARLRSCGSEQVPE